MNFYNLSKGKARAMISIGGTRELEIVLTFSGVMKCESILLSTQCHGQNVLTTHY